MLFVQDANNNNNYNNCGNGSDGYNNNVRLISDVCSKFFNVFAQKKASGRAGKYDQQQHYRPETRPTAGQSSRHPNENRCNEMMTNEVGSRSRRRRDLDVDSLADDHTDVTTYRYDLFRRIGYGGYE